MKRTVIVAVLLVIAGALIFTGALAALDFDFGSLSTKRLETNTYEISDAFDKISIDVDTCDVTFIPSKDGKCWVACYEEEKVKHSVEVKDGILIIDTVDNRKWYEHIGISFKSPNITVHLSQKEYASLVMVTDTGNIEISEAFTFTAATCETDTGNIDWYAAVSDTLKLCTDTGEIKVNDITVGALNLTTATGNIQTSAVNCEKLTAESDTGNIRLKKTIATDSFSIESDTGNVSFDYSDAESIFVQTDTGDVKGSLLSEKVFITETSTGYIDVPKTISGGRCEITTATGDIKLSIN